MRIEFFGVRGSIPKPLTQNQIQDKIKAVLERITPEDLSSKENKEKFLNNLPKWINGTVGGNTACVELKSKSGVHLIFDAGSGIKTLGNKLQTEKLHPIHIFFSHLHWDHIQGIPFFNPLYNPKQEIHFYGVHDLKAIIQEQMQGPFFPVKYENLPNNIHYHQIKPTDIIKINDVTIEIVEMYHPDRSFSYKVTDIDGKSFIYATDTELTAENFTNDEKNSDFYKNADVIILDSQYTLVEALEKEHWGHSSFCYGIDFATKWNINRIFLFHHEPEYSDNKIYSLFAKAKMYNKFVCGNKIKVDLAVEGVSFEI